MTWLTLLLLSWLLPSALLAQLHPFPGPGRAASGGGAGFTQLASDTFPTNGPLAGNWTTITGADAMTVAAGAVQDAAVDGNDAAARYTAVTWPNDQYAECAIVAASTTNAGAGPIVRASTTANTYYRATVKGPFGATAVIRIEKFLTGVYSSSPSGNVTITLAANDIIRLSVTTSGSNAVLTATQNGVTRVSWTDSTAAILTGQAGLAVFVDSGAATDAIADNWAGGSIP